MAALSLVKQREEEEAIRAMTKGKTVILIISC